MNRESDIRLLLDAFKVVGVSMFQVVAFTTLYEASVEIYHSNFGEMSKIFGFGMQINMALFLMSILALTNSVAQVFTTNMMVRLVTPLTCGGVWIAFWGNIAEVVPRRFLLLAGIGLISFYFGALLAHRRCPIPQVKI